MPESLVARALREPPGTEDGDEESWTLTRPKERTYRCATL
jgi:hypothetical protein